MTMHLLAAFRPKSLMMADKLKQGPLGTQTGICLVRLRRDIETHVCSAMLTLPLSTLYQAHRILSREQWPHSHQSAD